jgi:DNA replication protein DnaC
MRDVLAELKALRLYGMANAWDELASGQDAATLKSARWLAEHLLKAEQSDRQMRSMRYQMHAAKFPMHRDLAGFDFTQSKVDEALIDDLATLAFTEQAHNVVLIGGTGTGKTHLATLLLDGGPGEHAGAGEGGRPIRAAGVLVAAHGSGHSG